jgi:hypothetical protein
MKTTVKQIPVKCPVCEGKGCAACNNGVIMTTETTTETTYYDICNNGWEWYYKYTPVPQLKYTQPAYNPYWLSSPYWYFGGI